MISHAYLRTASCLSGGSGKRLAGDAGEMRWRFCSLSVPTTAAQESFVAGDAGELCWRFCAFLLSPPLRRTSRQRRKRMHANHMQARTSHGIHDMLARR